MVKLPENKYEFDAATIKEIPRELENKIVAMVPVRGGSQRVLKKNTRAFADTTLLELKLRTLKFLNGIDRIVVSTDCRVSAAKAEAMGIKVQWRNAFYASSTVTNDQHWYHIAATTPGEVVFLAQVTSPLVRLSSMQAALDRYAQIEQPGSINSVSQEKKFLWENGIPINYRVSQTPKSQDLPEIVSLNFAVTVISKKEMMDKKNVVASNPSFLVLDKTESLDVDDELDFETAEELYKKRGLEWLLT